MGEPLTSPAPSPPTTRSQASRSESSMSPPVMFSSCLPPVPAKLVRRIQDGLFVEMGELSPDRLDFQDLLATEQSASSSKVHEVTDIIDWVQCFSVFTAIIHRSQPDRTPDLLGYQNLIVQTSLRCQEGRWVIYDRRFRLKASALRLQQWSTIDITLWQLAFPDTSLGRLPLSCVPQGSDYRLRPSKRTKSTNRPICLDWNDTPDPQCPHPNCKFEHTCYRCAHNYRILDKSHKALFCPNKPTQPQPLMGQPRAF